MLALLGTREDVAIDNWFYETLETTSIAGLYTGIAFQLRNKESTRQERGL